MNMQQIGRKISALRKERDMTQNELADKLGVSYQAVSSWERGLTMPDISKLPDISQVLNTPIDDLLDNSKQVELVKNVLNQNTSTYTGENKLYIDEVAEVAPMLKPSQVNNLVEHVEQEDIDLKSIGDLAPFLSKEVLSQLAEKATDAEDINQLCDIAPFLDTEILDRMALKIEQISGLKALGDVAPFISQGVLQQLAQKAGNAGNIVDLADIAPFIGKEYLDKLAIEIGETNGLGSLADIAPFVSREVLDELVLKSLKR